MQRILLVIVVLTTIVAPRDARLRSYDPLQPEDPRHNIDERALDVTLATQLSADRLWLLRGICERWTHRVAAAVYVDYSWNSNRKQYRAFVGETERLKAEFGETLTLRVLRQGDAETSENQRGESPVTYPVNLMRNTAIDIVNTSHFIMVDVDMWPSENLHDRLVGALHALDEEGVAERAAIVVPPFAFAGKFTKASGIRLAVKSVAEGTAFDSQIPRSVDDLKRCYFDARGNRRKIHRHKRGGRYPCAVFDRLNEGGHSSTNIEAWWTQSPGDLRRIPCINSERYEPYLAVAKTTETRYTDAFRGYGKNKVEFIMRLWLSNYTFYAVGGAFVFHHPHRVSESQKLWRNRGNIAGSKMKKENDAIFESILADASVEFSERGNVSLATPCCPMMLLSTYSNDRPPWCE